MLRAIQRSFALSRPLEEKLSGTGKYFNYKKGWGIVETKIGDVLIFHVRKHLTKVGCVFLFVISSDLRMEQHRDDDYQKNASHFIGSSTFIGTVQFDHDFTVCLEEKYRAVHVFSILDPNQIQPDESPDSIYFRWTSSEFCQWRTFRNSLR